MKAQLSEAALLGAAKSMLNGVTKSDAVGRIGKNKSNGAKDTEEMQVYFSKLKELVPFMPRNRKLSKLEIIQYVIDYICDLQLALEAHPASSPPPSSSSTTTTSVSSRPNAVVVVAAAAAGGSSSSSSSSPSNNNNRQPLGVIANVTSNLSNTCAAQEAHHEKLPSHLEELNTRPVSC